MKANEFVKKFGWEISIDVSKSIEKSSWVIVRSGGWFSKEFVELPELLGLIKSKRLIDDLGGIDKAYRYKNLKDNSCIHPKTGEVRSFTLNSAWGESVGFTLFPEQIKKAIADVESCQ